MFSSHILSGQTPVFCSTSILSPPRGPAYFVALAVLLRTSTMADDAAPPSAPDVTTNANPTADDEHEHHHSNGPHAMIVDNRPERGDHDAEAVDGASSEQHQHAHSSPRSKSGWDGKLRVERKPVIANPGALSDPEYSDEDAPPVEEIEADEGMFVGLEWRRRGGEDRRVEK